MANKFPGDTVLNRAQVTSLLVSANSRVDGALFRHGGMVTPTGEHVVSHFAGGVRRERVTITDMIVSVPPADGFGSSSLCTLPDSNVLVVAASCQLAIEVSGFSNTAGTDDSDPTLVHMALGRAATAGTVFSGKVEAAFIDTVQAVTTGGFTARIEGSSDADRTMVFVEGGTGEVWMNFEAATVDPDPTIVVSGWVDLYLIDLG